MFLNYRLDVSNFNTNKVKVMDNMFRRCTSLKKVDISNFNANNTYNLQYMFYHWIDLEEIDISKLEVKNSASKMNMFTGCSDQLIEKLKKQNSMIYSLDLIDRYYHLDKDD